MTYPNKGYVEWALRLDCAKEGCDPPHSDNGLIAFKGPDKPRRRTINNHAATLVSRRILPWVEADGGDDV